MKNLLIICFCVFGFTNATFASKPLFKTGRISLAGESFSIGMSIDKTLLQHTVRDFSSTLILNGIQDLFIKDSEAKNEFSAGLL